MAAEQVDRTFQLVRRQPCFVCAERHFGHCDPAERDAEATRLTEALWTTLRSSDGETQQNPRFIAMPMYTITNELRRIAAALDGPTYVDRLKCAEIAGSLRTVAAILDGEPRVG